ncbi:MAG TPA: hypothetical protein VMX35_09910 [Acidobacteriota bacterium]|nr:hypothetical protein [Acidobacteriota bacterium]
MEVGRWLAKEIGVVVVPGYSFFRCPADKRRWVHFCFSKRMETLESARARLLRIKGSRRLV